MRNSRFIGALLAGAALVGTGCAAPAGASAEGDRMTRLAFQIMVQQQAANQQAALVAQQQQIYAQQVAAQQLAAQQAACGFNGNGYHNGYGYYDNRPMKRHHHKHNRFCR